MSGGPKQTTLSNEATKQTGATSGQSWLTPYGAAEPLMKQFLGNLSAVNPQTGITGAERGAYEGLRNASQYGLPEMQGLFNKGILGGFDTLQSQLDPYTSGSYLDINSNPYTSQIINQVTDAARNPVHDMWTRAGRSFSPGEAGAVSKAITEGLAPTLFNQFNQQQSNQLGAINNLFQGGLQAAGAGQDAVSGIGQQMMTPYSVTLEEEAAKRGRPFESLNQFSNLLLPIASTFGRQNQTGTTRGSMIGTSNSTTQQESNPWMTGLGAGLGLLGMGLSPMTGGFGSTVLGGLLGR